MIRSMLFVPGSSEKLLSKASTSGADALILDLEDAVSFDQKSNARELLKRVLAGIKKENPNLINIVRINSLETEFWKDDLAAILPIGPDIIMLPKVSREEDVHILEEEMKRVADNKSGSESSSGDSTSAFDIEKIGIMPLIETALGLENAYKIASSSEKVIGMLLGAEDLTTDLVCKRTREGREIFYARSRMVACGRAAGVEIYDTPFTDTRDEEGIAMDSAVAKSLGFTGKAAITPRHIPVINEAFSPSDEDIEYAKQVLAAIEEGERKGMGAVSLNGKMIDAPIVERAKKVIEAAEEIGRI